VPGLQDRFRRVAEGAAEPPPIAKTLGMAVTRYGDGKAAMEMEVGERFYNPMGTLHGGIMTDLADATMGIAAISTLSEDETFTTLELKMNFIRPVFSGKIKAEAEVVHRGKTIAVVEAVIRDDEGKLVARCVATQMVLRKDPKS
jgi:uncharacterized protein (TIGR00369 family)